MHIYFNNMRLFIFQIGDSKSIWIAHRLQGLAQPEHQRSRVCGHWEGQLGPHRALMCGTNYWTSVKAFMVSNRLSQEPHQINLVGFLPQHIQEDQQLAMASEKEGDTVRTGPRTDGGGLRPSQWPACRRFHRKLRWLPGKEGAVQWIRGQQLQRETLRWRNCHYRASRLWGICEVHCCPFRMGPTFPWHTRHHLGWWFGTDWCATKRTGIGVSSSSFSPSSTPMLSATSSES